MKTYEKRCETWELLDVGATSAPPLGGCCKLPAGRGSPRLLLNKTCLCVFASFFYTVLYLLSFFPTFVIQDPLPSPGYAMWVSNFCVLPYLPSLSSLPSSTFSMFSTLLYRLFRLPSSFFLLLPASFIFLLPSSFFLLPSSFLLLLPSAFVLLPSSFFLLPSSFLLLLPSSSFFLFPSSFLKVRYRSSDLIRNLGSEWFLR